MTDWDSIIIGAGPAGIASAISLSEGGARVLLVEESPLPGGQIWRGIETASPKLADFIGPDYQAGIEYVARLRASKAVLMLNTRLWRAEQDGTVWLQTPQGIARHRGKTLLLATGAMERPVPIPGWTLPGVSTIGGLQILLKNGGLIPSGPLILAGTGPLFYLYAYQCLKAGKRDMVLLDTAVQGAWIKALGHVPRALTGKGPRYLIKGVDLLARLRWSRVPFYTGVKNIAIATLASGGCQLTCTAGGKKHSFDADRIGLHEGVIPEQHIARSLGCAFQWDTRTLSFTPQRDRQLASSVDGIYIAGDAGGVGGAMAAVAEGQLAAVAILQRLGRLAPGVAEARRKALVRERGRHLAPRPLLDRLYLPGASITSPEESSLICRCEEVACRDIRTAVADGCAGPNQVKAFLRAGMGPCQGRICGAMVSQIVALERGISCDEAGFYTIRSPLGPVTVGELAELADK